MAFSKNLGDFLRAKYQSLMVRCSTVMSRIRSAREQLRPAVLAIEPADPMFLGGSIQGRANLFKACLSQFDSQVVRPDAETQ